MEKKASATSRGFLVCFLYFTHNPNGKNTLQTYHRLTCCIQRTYAQSTPRRGTPKENTYGVPSLPPRQDQRHQCGSPALAAQTFCFYHARLHRGHAGFRRALSAPQHPGSAQLQLSPLEDRDAIQSALSIIIHALAAGQLEIRRATALFYGLQLASNNATRLNVAPYPPDVLTETAADPDGLEIAPPGATRTLTTNIADEVYDRDELPQDEYEDEEEDEGESSEAGDTQAHDAPPQSEQKETERLWWQAALTTRQAPEFSPNEPSSSPGDFNASEQTPSHIPDPVAGCSDFPPL